MPNPGSSPGVASGTASAALPLSRLMRERTRDLHTRAERTGIFQDLIRGTLSRHAYLLLLRNLWVVYRTLEEALRARGPSSACAVVARPELYRTEALASDLAALHGPGWEQALPLAPATAGYAARIAEAAEGTGDRLIAHAYVRYLGDLSGGQVVRRSVERALGLAPEQLRFFVFSVPGSVATYKLDLLAAIDRAGERHVRSAFVAEEAAVAFQLNIGMAEDLAALSAGRAG